jgi:predicted O-methyltransferase YrrM
MVGDALEIIPKLEGKFDLVFIDAEKSEYLDYLRLIEKKLHKGSVIVADNVEHAPSYLNYVRSSGKYSSKFMPVNHPHRHRHREGLEVSVKL